MTPPSTPPTREELILAAVEILLEARGAEIRITEGSDRTYIDLVTRLGGMSYTEGISVRQGCTCVDEVRDLARDAVERWRRRVGA